MISSCLKGSARTRHHCQHAWHGPNPPSCEVCKEKRGLLAESLRRGTSKTTAARQLGLGGGTSETLQTQDVGSGRLLRQRGSSARWKLSLSQTINKMISDPGVPGRKDSEEMGCEEVSSGQAERGNREGRGSLLRSTLSSKNVGDTTSGRAPPICRTTSRGRSREKAKKAWHRRTRKGGPLPQAAVSEREPLTLPRRGDYHLDDL